MADLVRRSSAGLTIAFAGNLNVSSAVCEYQCSVETGFGLDLGLTGEAKDCVELQFR